MSDRRKGPGFLHVTKSVADSRAWWAMTGAQLKVFTYLGRCCNPTDGAFPGVDGIVKASQGNLSERTVQRALADLLKAGLIRCEEEGGGRGKASVYRIVNPDTDDTVSDKETTSTGPGFTADSQGKRVSSASPKGCHLGAKNPGADDTPIVQGKKQRTPQVTSRLRRSSAPAGRCPAGVGGGVGALIRLGVAASRAHEVGADLTANEVLRTWMSKPESRQSATGHLLKLLESNGASPEPTPKQISQACRDGLIGAMILRGKTVQVSDRNVKYNADGIHIDGVNPIPVSLIPEIVFE